jgi:hypothetical protein
MNEILNIDPESLTVANCYLQVQNITKVSEDLEIPPDLVSKILAKREVKSYIDSVFMNLGFNNRFQMRNLMDQIIKKKLQELDEADISTNKDILEILAISHKMTIEHMDKEIALEKIRSSSAKVVTNVQINEGLGSTNYGSLVSKLINNQDVTDV